MSGEREDEALAGDAEPAGGAVETEQDDLFCERFELHRDCRNWALDAWIGRPARHVVTAAGGDLDAEHGRHEHHCDERQRESLHERLRSRQGQCGRQRQQRESRGDEESGAERPGRGALELIVEGKLQGCGGGRLRRRQPQAR